MCVPALAVVLAACTPATPTTIHSLLLATGTPPPVTIFPEAVVLTPASPVAPTATPSYQQWPAPPAMAIDPTKIYVATFKTAKGDMVVQLLADKAPLTVNNFIFLAKHGFYDNTTFHRVIADNFAQAATPPATAAAAPAMPLQTNSTPICALRSPACWPWPTPVRIPMAASSS